MKNIVILISGRGTNLEAILKVQQAHAWDARISMVISNRADASGLDVAKAYGLPVRILEHQHFGSRDQFDQALLEQIEDCQPDLVILAGFMRILSEAFVTALTGKLINIHPSLLPSFPGLKTHQAALDSGVKWHGSTVHFVTPLMDVGPIIAQGVVPVHQTDTVTILSERVLAIEHIIYPVTIEWFLKDQLLLQDGIVSVIPPQSQSFSLPAADQA